MRARSEFGPRRRRQSGTSFTFYHRPSRLSRPKLGGSSRSQPADLSSLSAAGLHFATRRLGPGAETRPPFKLGFLLACGQSTPSLPARVPAATRLSLPSLPKLTSPTNRCLALRIDRQHRHTGIGKSEAVTPAHRVHGGRGGSAGQQAGVVVERHAAIRNRVRVERGCLHREQ